MSKGKRPAYKYYVVREDALPEVFHKVMEVKNLLDAKRVPSVNEAVRRVGISRSAYYKHRKSIRSLRTLEDGAITTMLVVMENIGQAAFLCLSVFQEQGVEIIAFQQSPPVDGLISMLVTFRSVGIFELEDKLIFRLTQSRGVIRAESLRQLMGG